MPEDLYLFFYKSITQLTHLAIYFSNTWKYQLFITASTPVLPAFPASIPQILSFPEVQSLIHSSSFSLLSCSQTLLNHLPFLPLLSLTCTGNVKICGFHNFSIVSSVRLSSRCISFHLPFIAFGGLLLKINCLLKADVFPISSKHWEASTLGFLCYKPTG